jgi:alanine racemase
MSRPTHALIDLDALRHNCTLAQSLAPGSSTLAVIKSNAYGHGAVLVARALQPQVEAFGVACIEEAHELRAGGLHKPVLLMQGVFEATELQDALQHDFWVMVENERQLGWIAELSGPALLRAWLKVDTGMGRLGFALHQARAVYRQLATCAVVHPEIVLTTHMARADELDCDSTTNQLARFDAALGDIDAPRSIANSPALMGWPAARAQWNRPGYMLYGCSPFATPHPVADRLRPVMTMQSAVISLHDIAPGEGVGYGSTWIASRHSRIATIAMGYCDGYPRHAVNGTPVLVNGRPAPLAGRVSMDMITVDVTELPGTRIGDPVELWGKHLSVNTVAAYCGTSGYEILARLSDRVPQVVSHL